MQPTISLSALVDFEHTHNIELPEGYREFLLNVGNGGAGPFYGLLPLEKWNDALWGEIDEPKVENPKVRLLASESPLLPEVEYGDDWEEHLDNLEHGAYQGAITICEQGCTYYSLLIVTGKARGRVVNIDGDMQPPKFAPFPDFLSWYDGWLDLTLKNAVQGWYGYPEN